MGPRIRRDDHCRPTAKSRRTSRQRSADVRTSTSPQVSGTIWQALRKRGQNVSKGQTLFIIDQVPYKAALQTAEANVAAAEASVATAQLTSMTAKKNFFRPQSRLAVRPLDGREQPADGQSPVGSGRGPARQCRQQSLLYGCEGSVERCRRHAAVPRRRPGERLDAATADHRVGQLDDVRLLLDDREPTALAHAPLRLDRRDAQNMPDVQLHTNDGSMYDLSGRVESISGVIDTSTGSVCCVRRSPNPDGLLHSGGSGNVILTSTFKGLHRRTAGRHVRTPGQGKYVYKLADGKAASAMIGVEKISDGKGVYRHLGSRSGRCDRRRGCQSDA